MLNNQDTMTGADKALALRAVLILEDEVLLSVLLEEVVREMGASEVHAYSDPELAQQVAETADLDCAILDIHLGRGTSFAVADALEARGIPFIFSSATAPVDMDERFRHRPLLGKPFADAELQAQLISLLRR